MSSGGDDEMTTCREVVADHAYEEPSTILAALLSSPACRAEMRDALTKQPTSTERGIVQRPYVVHGVILWVSGDVAEDYGATPLLVAREAPDAR